MVAKRRATSATPYGSSRDPGCPIIGASALTTKQAATKRQATNTKTRFVFITAPFEKFWQLERELRYVVVNRSLKID
jgi:hypothetical protein